MKDACGGVDIMGLSLDTAPLPGESMAEAAAKFTDGA